MHARRNSRRAVQAVPTQQTLPKQLQNVVPLCAQSCLETYISQGYDDSNDCSGSDLSCLCSTYSSYGLSLGELGLVCLQISDCSSASLKEEEQQAVFGICSGQKNAVEATHTVLSPPATTQSSSTRTTSTLPLTTTLTTSSDSSTASLSASSRLSNTTSSSAAAASTSTSASSASTGLSSPQVIGISIAAVGFIVLAIAFAYSMACVRRRSRKQKNLKHMEDFPDEKAAPQSFFTFPETKGRRGTIAEPRATTNYTKSEGAWQTQPDQIQHYQPRQKTVNHKQSMSGESFRSNISVRTVSRLLPEKPTRIHPQNERPSAEPVTVQTPATIFEEDRFSIVPRPVPSLPKNPRQPQYAHQFTKSPEPAMPPPLSLNKQYMKSSEPTVPPPLSLSIPRQGTSNGAIQQTITQFPNPQDYIPRPFYENTQAASSNNSFLNYYEGPDSGSPEDYYPYTPIDELSQTRRPAPAAILITKPTYPPVAIRTSMASDHSRRTSFESTDPDEPTPPDEPEEDDKRLTPVAESPIASIRYPKIPRGSNQAVPRSPPQSQFRYGEQQWQLPGRNPVTPENRRIQNHSPSLSGSTLAAKRLGDSAQQNLEKGLRITTNGSPPQQERGQQHLRGYGKPLSNSSPANWPLPTSEPLKSPLWEPKLTPRRMGGDLYLSVSVATPKQAQFFER